jgi:hypothetical protein
MTEQREYLLSDAASELERLRLQAWLHLLGPMTD